MHQSALFIMTVQFIYIYFTFLFFYYLLSALEGNNDLKNKGIWDQFNPQTNKNKRDKTDVDKKHYELAEHISKHIFKNYPEYQMPLLAKHLMKGVEQRMYDGMVMELKQADSNFNILLTDSFSHTNYNGQSRTSEQYPSLYQCSKGTFRIIFKV